MSIHPIPTSTDIPLTQGRQRSLEVGSAIALHAHYATSGGHADCYAADVLAPVSLAAFVHAFYTSPLFRLERWILALVLGMPSTDAEAKAVAVGEAPFDPSIRGCAATQDRREGEGRFAAWTVEARSESQLVMCDYQGRTRSWFMVEEMENGPSTSSGRADVRGKSVRLSSGQAVTRTRVYFGTAIAASRGGLVPFAFRLLMPFHHLYSRALLWSAVRGLRAG